ncbi:MAG TPA: TetR/AcrR family transcriptional regulator [Bryobacteraceae bacterium]|nr:TetR/AcrR family transcriptional regulator [Bryobacteraceae bacterium]
MPRTATPNQRSRILASARAVFARLGAGATIDDIAKEAGVSHGLAYRYFPGKDSLLQALVDEALEAGRAGLKHFEEMSGAPEERLALLLSQLIESRRARPEFYLVLDHVRHAPATPPKLRKQIQAQKEAFLDLLRRLIVAGQKRGKVYAGDPDRLVMAVSIFLEGMGRMAQYEPAAFGAACPGPEMILRVVMK